MTSLAAQFGLSSDDHPRKDAFLRWQCHVRQMMMRDEEGRPNDAITPALTPAGDSEPMGHIITLMPKAYTRDIIAEMKFMAKKTNDPAQIRDGALRFFSATHYQKAKEFAGMLTATFPPKSAGAQAIRKADRCTLTFEAYGQRYDLDCKVWKLAPKNPFYQYTYWHNKLFNPSLHPDTEVLAFEPGWAKSTADPDIANG